MLIGAWLRTEPVRVHAATTALKQTIALTGRVLDLQNGYVFFSSGGSYRLRPGAPVYDLDTKRPFRGDRVTGLYARAQFTADHSIAALELTTHAIPMDDAVAFAQDAVSVSSALPNPELNTGKIGYTGEPVLVSFTVTVPPSTPQTDNVYISSEASRWDPLEIRMDRIDALHYRITRRIRSGTEVTYRYTRGSWQASERGRTGIEGPPRAFTVENLDIERRDDTVAHWSDESPDGSAPITPETIPTPFNNNPFVVPTTRPIGS